MTVHIGQLAAGHAGEALTVQRAARQCDAPRIPALTETVDQLRADLASGVLAFGAWLVTGSGSEANLRLYRRTGYAVVGESTDAIGGAMALLEKARS